MFRLKSLLSIGLLFLSLSLFSQDYFLKSYAPFDKTISSPEEFLGYPIGEWHTRHDMVVAYFTKLAEQSENAELIEYGRTHEGRKLIVLAIANKSLLDKKDEIQQQHLELTKSNAKISNINEMPLIAYMGHNIHGNEASGGEASLLLAYTLLASQNAEIKSYLDKGIIFIDPVINPDGRERHSMWANTHKGNPLISDPLDIEHNEIWPGGRTNHYWFDLNRDIYLVVHPESKARLKFFHTWYPNVATDFHEMWTNMTYFFEPKKKYGIAKELIPTENHNKLNPIFAKEFGKALDSIGTFYFSGEIFDANYPGYGSTYLDIQGGLALLFEQASSRGHVQESNHQLLTFEHTIRNQFLMGLTTLKTSFANKGMLLNYQKQFFESAISSAKKDNVKAYIFGDAKDKNRTKAFVDILLQHKIEVYELKQSISQSGKKLESGSAFVVPTAQAQYRMVRSIFETNKTFIDSVWYDASAWSLAHFYNMPFVGSSANVSKGNKITDANTLFKTKTFAKADYAYLVDWNDYNSAAFLSCLFKHNIKVYSAFKPFTTTLEGSSKNFNYGTLMIPVSLQKIEADKLFEIISKITQKTKVPVYSTNSGFSSNGSHFGGTSFKVLEAPKVLTLVHGSVSGYEAGEMWHLFDQRLNYPITKVRIDQFNRIDFSKYNTLIMVSGGYSELDSAKKQKIAQWVMKGNTLITSRGATAWVIRNKIVHEQLVQTPKKEKKEGEIKPVERLAYDEASERAGAKEVGGAIFETNIDLTHPLAFGYTSNKLPVYHNSSVYLMPSKNPYSTVAKYTSNPLINGYITDFNLNTFIKPAASLIVSPLGRGRVILFADNPNFRGSWYGTNKLLFNAIFLGQHIQVPR